jgi:Gene product 88
MPAERPLLTLGNSKLGQSIHVWSIPAVKTCPGSTPTCRMVCYAEDGHYLSPSVRASLRWRYRQSLRADFAARVLAEIECRGVLVLRVHGAGDFYSPDYAATWLDLMRLLPRVRFYFYTRSWRVADVAPFLERMALLPNCRAWYSLDCDTGIPNPVPPRVRLAYLQCAPGEETSPGALASKLVFLTRPLRGQAKRLPLPIHCDEQVDRRQNCGQCGRCFR